MSNSIYNPGNVKFSLAQLAKEEEARKSGRNKNPYTKELQKDREEQHKAKYVNPQFAEKEVFKDKDNAERLTALQVNRHNLEANRNNLQGDKNSLRANRNNPLTLMKPLRPNILDAAADERQKELAEQRKNTGLKWVIVNQR